MNTLLIALLILVVGGMNALCFILGANIGQKVSKGESITPDIKSPMEVIRERKDKQAAEKEQSRIDTILQNIESYDGTSNGQKDVPGVR